MAGRVVPGAKGDHNQAKINQEQILFTNKQRVGCSLVTTRATERSGRFGEVEPVFHAAEVDWQMRQRW